MGAASEIEAARDEFAGAADKLNELTNFIRDHGPSDPILRITMQNNMVVSVAATIEEGIRNLFEAYLTSVQHIHVRHSDLRPDLQKANLDGVITHLRDLKKNFRGGVAEVARVAKNLSICFNDEPGYSLMTEQITYNQANFQTGQITEIAKRLGIGEILRDVCSCEEVQEWTNEDDIDRRITLITTEWNGLFKERDLVMHRLSQANAWGPEKIARSILLAKIVVCRLGNCLLLDAEGLSAAAQVRGASAEA